MTKVEKDLFYTEDHEWVRVEDNIAVVGITDYAQDQLGDIVYAEAVDVGEEVELADVIGSVESVKMASDVYSPVSGKIVEINELLEDESELINEDPYGTWFVKIDMADPAELDQLMDDAAYIEFCKGE
ncbi:MAG TPA: glycine cleavage system protein GcvH [Clostridiaceae bacterium]|nr:glycine cleavage system protein GcvH [Clostridiaceae bacterium]